MELSKGKYLEASVRAKVLGDEASIQYFRAAADYNRATLVSFQLAA
jgi:hypothetical protein